MKVSVIVPNYNHAQYLNQRIDSILNQTFQDFELILLDDCSSDNSRDVLDSYKNHPKVSHCVYNTTNSGSTFVQWEKGIQLAQGDYIWIAESDDWADTDFLKIAIDEIEKHPNAGLVFTSSCIVNSNGETTYKNESGNMGTITCYKGNKFVRDKLSVTNYIWNASMVVFRKSLFPFNALSRAKELKYCGDWLIYSHLALFSDIVEINRTLNFFRTHADNVSGNAEKSGKSFTEGLQVYNILKSNFSLKDRIGFTLQWGKQLCKYKTKYNPAKEEFRNLITSIARNNFGILIAYNIYILKNSNKQKSLS